MDTTTTFLVIAAGLVLWYLAKCWRHPYRPCPVPWCRSRANAGDGRGNYRHKKPPSGWHAWIHPEPEYRRLGARLFGWR